MSGMEHNPVTLLKNLCEQKGYRQPKYESESSSSHYKVTVSVNGQSYTASETNYIHAKKRASKLLFEKLSKDEEASASCQEGTSKSVKRKLKDSEEKSKGEQDYASKRHLFRIDEDNEKSESSFDSFEEDSKSNAKFSFDWKDKKDFMKSKLDNKKRPLARRRMKSISMMKKLTQSMSQTGSSSSRSIKTSFDPDEELALTINELLSLPEKPDDDEKSLDEMLDDLDVQIAEKKEKDRLQNLMLDETALQQKRKKEDREARYAANAINRKRLATELTQPVLKMMFGKIVGSLEDIKAGLIESSRHKAYFKSLKTRQALLYTMITHPFSDQQVDWTLKELADIWLRTKQEHADNNEYIWKVLMPECMIRLYSEFFQVTMKEAEKMIKETPFDSDSDSE